MNHVGVNHQLWTLLNKSFIAPIQVETWVFLANLPASALEECRVNALKGVQYLDKGELIKAPFTMSFLDITKCASLTGIYGRTKGTMVFNKQSAEYYLESVWNVYQPYLKCACKFLDSRAACESSIIWFDHAVWYLLNHLDALFPNKPVEFHLPLFCSWLGGQAKNLVLAQIAFINFRNIMLDTLKEMRGEEPGTILTTYNNFKGVKTISSLLNPNVEDDSSTPPLKRPSLPSSSSGSFTSFLTPSSSNTNYSQGRGRARSFTSNGRARGMPMRHLLDY